MKVAHMEFERAEEARRVLADVGLPDELRKDELVSVPLEQWPLVGDRADELDFIVVSELITEEEEPGV